MLEDCHNIEDLRKRARRRLPLPIFDVLDGGAESEITARRNTAAFDDIKLIPKCLVNVERLSTSTRILGQPIEWPVFCSPTGGSRLFHTDGELAVARAAAKAGTLYGLSTLSTYSIEEVAAASAGPKIYQLYICEDRDLTHSLIARAKRAGYGALCVTVDTAVPGQWERDLRSGVFGPLRHWPLRTFLGFGRHPLWAIKRRGKNAVTSANFVSSSDGPPPVPFQLNATVTWKELRDVVDVWGGPLALKGVMSPDDARRAADVGVTAIIVSNHGGRQLDGASASIEALPEIARAVGERLEVILDGGVRRGVHVLKALACGAKACSIGRPYLYGLSAGGEQGVAKALEILRTEFLRSMQLSGCADLASIDESLISGAHFKRNLQRERVLNDTLSVR